MKKLIYSIMALTFAITALTGCQDVPEPYTNPNQNAGGQETIVPGTPAGTGTEADPYNVTAALEKIKALPADGKLENIYVKGKIRYIKSVDASQYGNAEYYISDDNTKKMDTLFIYRGKYLGNAKFTATDQIKVGDEVVILGTFVNFKGNTPESEGNNSYIYMLNGTKGEAQPLVPGVASGTGTEADPYNVTAALEKIRALKADGKLENIYVKGKIRYIKSVDASQYGNAEYYISDDNTKLMDTLFIYRSKYLGNVKFTAKDQIKVGDEVVVQGTFVNFKGNTPESEANSSWIYMLNGEKAQQLPLVPGVANGAGTEADPYNVTAALAKIRALAADGKLENIYVKGKIRKISSIDTGNFGNAEYYISDDHTKRMDTLLVYRSLYLGNAKFTAKDQIKVGDEVVIQGTFVNYKGNSAQTMANNSHIHMLNGKKEGGTTPKPNKDVNIEGLVVTLTNLSAEAGTERVTYEVSNLAGKTIKPDSPIDLGDGLTLTISKGDGATAPTFHASSKLLRIYAKNTFTLTGQKNIAQVIVDCDKFNNVSYVGNPTATVSFDGNKVVYKNEHSENKGGTQMRIAKFTVVYAK